MRRFLLFFILLLSAHVFAERVYVLCYHSFDDARKNIMEFSLDELREQMTYLKNEGFTFVSYTDITNGNVRGVRNVLVTMDDGYKNNYKAFTEVLEPMGIKPLLALYTRIIGAQVALSWDEVREMHARGCDIASHSHTHAKLTSKAYARNKETFLKEIHGSKEILERELGVPITAFVYPYGIRSDEAKKELAKAGYKTAFTIVWGGISLPFPTDEERFELPRYMTTHKAWKAEFDAIIANAKRLEEEGAGEEAPPSPYKSKNMEVLHDLTDAFLEGFRE